MYTVNAYMNAKLDLEQRVKNSKTYRDHLCRILKPFIGEAFPETPESIQKDMIHHIDLEGPLGTAGARGRDIGFFKKYPWQFTIRSRTNGVCKHQETKEIESLLAGKIKYYLFYYYSKEGDGVIRRYQVINVGNLLKCIERYGLKALTTEHENTDGSKFLAFNPLSKKMLGFSIVILARV